MIVPSRKQIFLKNIFICQYERIGIAHNMTSHDADLPTATCGPKVYCIVKGQIRLLGSPVQRTHVPVYLNSFILQKESTIQLRTVYRRAGFYPYVLTTAVLCYSDCYRTF
jgi:hypothetical protein